MNQTLELLSAAQVEGIGSSLNLLLSKQHSIPNSIQFSINRYHAQHSWVADDAGMLVYHYSNIAADNYIELRFCIAGNRFCEEKSCKYCNQKPTNDCNGTMQTVDVYKFHFTSTFLYQYTNNVKLNNKKDEILAFKQTEGFTKIFPISTVKRNILNALLNNSYTGALENIFFNSKIHELLLSSLDYLIDEKYDLLVCKFLRDEHSLQAVYKSRDILLENIGNPLTIKELSRKVAINECYLKKGFKEVFGTTIFDFYQQQRMEHAKYLLYEKGLSVTDVSSLLGYSSISHFSAAFKKHTGLKPCELFK